MTREETCTYIHSFMTLTQRFDPNHDTCVTRLVWRRRVPWGLVVLARGYPCVCVSRLAGEGAERRTRGEYRRRARWLKLCAAPSLVVVETEVSN